MEEQNEELRILTTEEKIQSVKALIEAQQKSPYKSRFNEILDSFEDFLMMRPEPPDGLATIRISEHEQTETRGEGGAGPPVP